MQSVAGRRPLFVTMPQCRNRQSRSAPSPHPAPLMHHGESAPASSHRCPLLGMLDMSSLSASNASEVAGELPSRRRFSIVQAHILVCASEVSRAAMLVGRAGWEFDCSEVSGRRDAKFMSDMDDDDRLQFRGLIRADAARARVTSPRCKRKIPIIWNAALRLGVRKGCRMHESLHRCTLCGPELRAGRGGVRVESKETTSLGRRRVGRRGSHEQSMHRMARTGAERQPGHARKLESGQGVQSSLSLTQGQAALLTHGQIVRSLDLIQLFKHCCSTPQRLARDCRWCVNARLGLGDWDVAIPSLRRRIRM